MAGERLRRLRELESEGLSQRDEAVEEAMREHDVVVDDECPIRSWLVVEQHGEVLELASVEVGGRARRDAHVVARSTELVERGGDVGRLRCVDGRYEDVADRD